MQQHRAWFGLVLRFIRSVISFQICVLCDALRTLR